MCVRARVCLCALVVLRACVRDCARLCVLCVQVLGPKYLQISTDPKGIKVMALLIMIAGFLTIGYTQLARLRRH